MTRRSETETTIERRTMAPWIKWGTILGCIAAAAALVDVAWSMTNVAVENLPVIKKQEIRIANLEQSAVTNSIILQNRFDREDEQLEIIKNILLRRNQNFLNSTN